ncbi:MAG: sulfatase-like hydrolase/transferase [Oceanihabitans sp.]
MLENILDNIKGITSLFGDKIIILNVLLVLVIFILTASMIKKKWLRFIISLLFSAFLILQLISLFFTQTFVSYPFFVHLNVRDVSSTLGLYPNQILLATTAFLVFMAMFYFSLHLSVKILQQSKSAFIAKLHTNAIKILLICISLFVLVFIGKGIVNDTYQLLSLLKPSSNNMAFKTALKQLKMEDYVSEKNIVSKKGKNIVVISLESLEKGFLSDSLKHLTPNLSKLKQNWNYYNLEQNFGGEWTSGSLYTSLTGFPAYFGIHGNDIFKNAYHSKISSVSKVLKTANYNLSYFVGDANFSGTKEMLYALNFNHIIDKYKVENTNETNSSRFGLRDKDLFDLAKTEIKSKAKHKEPFAVFISTTDTHAPDGIYDKRLEKKIKPQKNNLNFMVSAVDYMIGDLIQFLKKESLLENTTVYIYPDHLKMGDPTMFNHTGERGLYLITNATNKKTKIDTTKTLYQIDLPKIILNGAAVKHNMKFLTDYISGDKNQFITANKNEIRAINTAGISRTSDEPYVLPSKSKNYKKYKKDTLRFIAHAAGAIEDYTYTNSLEALNKNYKNGFRLFELDIIKTKDQKYVAAHDWKHWAKITNYTGELPPTEADFLKQKIYQKFTPLNMQAINQWFLANPDAILITDKINEPLAFAGNFIDKNRLMMELFSLPAVQEGIAAKIKSVIPSQKVLTNIKGDKLKQLKQWQITDIAISRNFIKSNKKLLKQLKENNINAYAYHINFDPEINEEYVVKYEMDYIYGIYADLWNFEK